MRVEHEDNIKFENTFPPPRLVEVEQTDLALVARLDLPLVEGVKLRTVRVVRPVQTASIGSGSRKRKRTTVAARKVETVTAAARTTNTVTTGATISETVRAAPVTT